MQHAQKEKQSDSGHLPVLFKIIEFTRAQLQYGYILGGIPRNEVSDLAQHHYLVTFIAWQLALHLEQKAVPVDVRKVLEFSLIHDVGELFGGDIAMPYARANQKAYRAAKAFEEENQRFIQKFFGSGKRYMKGLMDEILGIRSTKLSTEAVIAKVADYVECTMFKFYVGRLREDDFQLTFAAIEKRFKIAKDQSLKAHLDPFLQEWKKQMLSWNHLDGLNKDIQSASS